MLCENCGKNKVVYNSVQIINGQKKEWHLCEECAKAMGLIKSNGILGDILYSLISDVRPQSVKDKACANCGMRLSEVLQTAYLGCSKCYDEFKEFIIPSIKRIQPQARHIGKAPNTKQEQVEAQQPSAEQKILALQKQLKQAVLEERYEDASRINDQIKEIKGAN